MSISVADIIQSNTGAVTATSATASLPSGTTDGSTVFLFVMTYGSAAPISSGFTRDHGSTASQAKAFTLRKSNVAAGETSWSITGPVSAQPIIWFALEVANLARDATIECNANYLATTGATSIPSNTTPASTIYEGLAFCFQGGQNTANTTVPAWTNQTNDFIEFAENSIVGTGVATSAALSIYTIYDISAGYQCTATSSVTVTAGASLAVYAAAATKRQPNPDVICGFEIGTTAGLTTGNTAAKVIDSQAGTVAIVSTSPRTGTYCLQLSGTSAAANVAWTSTGALSLYTAPAGLVINQQYVMRVSFYFPSSLPGADVTICAVDQGNGLTGSGVQIVYRTASQKIGAQMSETGQPNGTEVLSATTVAADTWYDLDVYVDMANAARAQQYFCRWSLDDVEQTTATVTSQTAGSVQAITSVRLGWLTGTTATIRYDDFMGSKHPGHYPLGDIRVYPLVVDPAGTVTISGTTANFNTFTANGTMAAWNATTARGAVDEIPPTISASADGVAQITVAASDYMQFPMGTRDMSSNLEAPRGIRWILPGWAASTTAATIGFRGFDGTVETILFAAADPNFDNSTTAPAYVCRMHRDLASNTPFVWSQAKVDALCARVGFSTGATPDVGVHAILAELACRKAQEFQVFEQDGVLIYAGLDPDTSNVISLRLVAPADGDAWATYVVNGTPENRNATAGDPVGDLFVIGAESNAVVSSITGGRV